MMKTKKLWQRVLAMALVLMMVLSYMPAGVVAEGEAVAVESKVDTLVKATLTATASPVENEGDPVTYAYAVKVEDGLGADVTDAATIAGLDSAEEEFVVTVTYKGMTISLNNKEAQASGSVSGSVAVSYMTAHNLTVGQAYDVANYQPQINADHATAEGAWSFVEAPDYANYVADGVVGPAGNALTFGTYQYTVGTEVVAEVTLIHNISAPTYTISFTDAEGNEIDAEAWYNSEVSVFVKAVANVKLAVKPVHLPTITVSSATVGDWGTEDNQTFTAEVKVNSSTTIAVTIGALSELQSVKIDNNTPAISNVDAYKSKGTTYVEFDVSVGDSGVGAVKVNDTACDFVVADNHVTVTVPKDVKLEGTYTIAVTSVAGLTGTAEESKQPTNEISVEIAVPDAVIGTANGVTYLPAGAEFAITVSNYKDNFTPTVTDKNNNAVTVNWTGDKGTFSLAAGESLDGLKVSVVDAKNRTGENSFETVYKVDNTAPVIAISGLQTSELTYSKEEQTYTVKITDDAVLGDTYAARYFLAGDTTGTAINLVNGEGSFTLTHGMNLVKIEASATNATGLSAEKTFETNVLVDTDELKISAELTAVDANGDEIAVTGYTGVSGTSKYFVHLDPAETNEIDGTVTLTMVYTLDEDYPDTAYLEANGWASSEGVWRKVISWTVNENTTHAQDISVTAKDLSEKVPTGNIIMGDTDGFKMVLSPVDGVYTATLCVDRRTPSTPGEDDTVLEVPEISLVSNGTPVNTVNGIDLYNEDFTFSVDISDASAEGNDSGIESITWMVDANGADFLDESEVKVNAAGKYDIDVKAKEAGECNEVYVVVVAVDKMGNTFTKTETFAFDNLDPRVKVSYEDKGTVKNENFFNGARIATITYEDLNLSAAQYFEDAQPETNCSITTGEATAEINFTADGHHTLSTYAADLAQNENTLFESDAIAPYDFYVDTTAPVVTVLQETSASQVGVNGATEYYNDEITYTISAADAYMGTGYEDVEAWVKYTKELADGSKKEETIDLLTAEGRQTVIAVTNGETLTDLQVYACDNAGWTTDLVTDLDFAEDTENPGVYSFNKDTAVDMTPAEVSVKRTGDLVQSVDGVDYYDDAVTYDLTITDRFLLKADVMNVEVVVDYNTDEKDLTLKLADLECDEKSVDPTYKTSFTVANGDDVSAITIVVKDNAGNITKTIDVGGDELTSFKYKSDKNTYTGNRVVVDTTAPTASMAFSENVKSVYTNDGTVYVVLDKPATGASGLFAGQQAESVTVTITAKDKNITLHKSSIQTNEGKGKWIGTKVDVNTDRELTYTETITVKADKTGAFAFDLRVRDMAGNALEALAFEPIGNTTVELAVDADGSFGTTVSVDRRRPSSVDDDNAAPVINIAPSLAPTTSSNDLDLFSNAFNFNLSVTDGQEGILNSGIKTVNWKIEDSVGFVVASAAANSQPSGTYTKAFSIPVAVNGVGETNEAKVTITAVDNVGNTTIYVKEFAVDNQAPRIVVNYDNNSAQNGKYFKANRTATIEVTDINFNAQNTEITTQVAPTAWVQEGDTWTSTCSYTADGEYTFAVRSVDLANNATEDAAVDYEGEVAPKDFVIDKTAPVITVTYDPSAPIGKDDQGVNYYDKELGITVNIREVNFKASDVNAVFNSNNALGGFAGGSGSYTAHETFTEGNEYHFSISYTDMAGNAATTYESATFSVDLTDPTIAITGGDMTDKDLNIVQDNLVLEFTIDDAQSNLSTYDVKVTRLNNEFKEETVSGRDYYSISSADERTKVVVDFKNIIKEKGNDGIYTVEISAKDYAGRKVNMTVLFSLNRFGSTFTTDDPFTQSFLTPSTDGAVYQNTVGQKLIFKEINPNKVWQDSAHAAEGSVLTVVVNGTTTVLKEGVDYTMSVAEEGAGKTKWYVYTYEVDPSIFMQGDSLTDGRYSLLIYGEDEAGNKNTNESNEFGIIQMDANGEYSGKIEFTLDATAPIISTTGIETGGSYNAENQYMKIFLSDNTPMGVVVHLNSQSVQLLESAGAANEAWLIWDDAEGCYILNVPEMNTLFGRQSVDIRVTDAAGNSAEATVDDFTVSSNLFVRFTNSIWFWIVCGLLILLILLMLIFLKKKKKVAA